MDKSEIAAMYSKEVIREIREKASGFIAMDWPLAEAITEKGFRNLLDELVDCDPDENEGRGPPGNYL